MHIDYFQLLKKKWDFKLITNNCWLKNIPWLKKKQQIQTKLHILSSSHERKCVGNGPILTVKFKETGSP